MSTHETEQAVRVAVSPRPPQPLVTGEDPCDDDLILLIPAPAAPFRWRRPAQAPEPTADQGALRALTDAIQRLPPAGELEQILPAVVDQFCDLLKVRRCSLFLRESQDGIFKGRAARQNGERFAVDQLIAGTAADAVTREVLATRRPLAIADAAHDTRPVRASVRRWKVRSLLAVPLLFAEEIDAIAFLDDLDRSHEFTAAEQDLALTYGQLAGSIIASARATSELRATVMTTERRNSVLWQAVAADDRLSALALAGADVHEIARAVSELTGRPCALFDAGWVRRAAAAPEGARVTSAPLAAGHLVDENVRSALSTLEEKRAGIIGPFPGRGVRARYLVAPVRSRDECCGYLVLDEWAARFGTLDLLISRQAATIAALEMTAEQRAAAQEWDTGEVLLGELIRGNRDLESLQRRACRVRVAIDEPHALALVTARDGHPGPLPTARHAGQLLAAKLARPRPVLATGVTEGIVLLVPLEGAVPVRTAMEQIARACENWCQDIAPSGALSVVISTACRRPEDYVRGYAEARDVGVVIDGMSASGSHAVTAIDCLGAARLMVLRPDSDSAARFLQDTLGPLAQTGDPRHGELLQTVQAFLECGRNVRACARAVHVHENTIRYRLSRVHEVLGLDVLNDADAQLTLQMALTVRSLARPAEPADLSVPPDFLP